MNQCVPGSWDVDENIPVPPKLINTHHLPSKSSNNSFTIHVPTLDYEVAELTWENGQVAMHGLGLPRTTTTTTTTTYNNNNNSKATSSSSTWEKRRAGGTLESIVDQATSNHPTAAPFLPKSSAAADGDLVPWLTTVPASTPSAAEAVAAAAGVPCNSGKSTRGGEGHYRRGGSWTRVESCSGVPDVSNNLQQLQKAGDHSVGNSSTTWGSHKRDGQRQMEFGRMGWTSNSMGSPENTISSGKPWANSDNKADDHDDSVSHDHGRRPPVDFKEKEKEKEKGKSSISTKSSRAAAIHNQSERKRRDKINQRMKTLQKLIPNSSKTDKASMLDEVIEYLKQLQAQVHMMSKLSMSSMMLPMAMQQQQLHMSMMGMAGIGMAAGMGVMDINTLAGRSANMSAAMPPHFLHPGAFLPAMASWDAGDRLHTPTISAMMDPLSAAFLACHSQPMTMEAYNRLASMYQQFQQQQQQSTLTPNN